MADIQKIVDAVLSVEDDNNKFGVLDGIIDADWHPDHLKPDSEDPYDKAISLGAAELQGLSQMEKFDLMFNVASELADGASDEVLSQRYDNWINNTNLATFKPDTTDIDESTEVNG